MIHRSAGEIINLEWRNRCTFPLYFMCQHKDEAGSWAHPNPTCTIPISGGEAFGIADSLKCGVSTTNVKVTGGAHCH